MVETTEPAIDPLYSRGEGGREGGQSVAPCGLKLSAASRQLTEADTDHDGKTKHSSLQMSREEEEELLNGAAGPLVSGCG